MSDHGDALVGVEWLAQARQVQSQPTQAGLTAAGPIVLHAEWSRGGTRNAYADGHIPGAMHFDTDWLESGYPTWQLLPAALLQRRFGEVGLRAADTIVVYAQQYATACRVWWALRYCGATDVRVLCGGLKAWRGAGLALSTEPAVQLPSDFSAPVQSALLADCHAAQAAALLRRLIDVRSTDEYRGLRSGYSYLERAGRIPGALHADVEPLNALLDGADLAGIASYWRACGVLQPRGSQRGERGAAAPPVFYCGGGWRSSVACFCALLLGMTAARNYSEGWCGWSTRYVQDTVGNSPQSGDMLRSAQQPLVAGSTPGWRQHPTANPIATG